MKIKSTIINIFLIVIIVAIIGNIWNQVGVLLMARQKTQELANRTNELILEKELLTKRNEMATSSATMDLEVRRKLGMGNEKDMWIVEEKKENKQVIKKAEEIKPIGWIVEEWIRVFTGK